jgi:hypothetical protein
MVHYTNTLKVLPGTNNNAKSWSIERLVQTVGTAPYVQINSVESQEFQLRVMSTSGALIQQRNMLLGACSHRVTLEVGNLVRGGWILTVLSGGKREVAR